MAIQLLPVDQDRPFKHGEIIADCNELAFLSGPIESASDVEFRAAKHPHSFVFILSAACDLEQDFKARMSEIEGFDDLYRDDSERQKFRANKARHEVPNLVLSPLWTLETFLQRCGKKDIYRQVVEHRNHPRWCRVGPLVTNPREGDATKLDLVLDCAYVFTWPMQLVHDQLRHSTVRLGYVDSPYREHFMQKFFQYQSRIGIDDLV